MIFELWMSYTINKDLRFANSGSLFVNSVVFMNGEPIYEW